MNKENRFSKKTYLWILLSVFFVLLIAFSACSGSGSAKKIEGIRAAGKLVVGTSADYPPYEFQLLKDEVTDIVGLDISIANAIARELGVELEVKNIVFHQLFEALNSGEIDMVIAGLAPNEVRKGSVDFSDIYYQAIQNMVIRAEDAEAIAHIEDLRGKRVGTQKGSIQGDMVKKVVVGGDFVEREKIDELIDDLKSNTVDAVILEKPVAESYVLRNRELVNVECTSGDFGTELGSAIAVKKGNSDLLDEINRILKKLKYENRIAEYVQDAMVLMMK